MTPRMHEMSVESLLLTWNATRQDELVGMNQQYALCQRDPKLTSIAGRKMLLF